MKIHKFETESQYQAHIHGRKAPRGTKYTTPVYRTKDNSVIYTVALTFVVGAILLTVYLIRTT